MLTTIRLYALWSACIWTTATAETRHWIICLHLSQWSPHLFYSDNIWPLLLFLSWFTLNFCSWLIAFNFFWHLLVSLPFFLSDSLQSSLLVCYRDQNGGSLFNRLPRSQLMWFLFKPPPPPSGLKQQQFPSLLLSYPLAYWWRVNGCKCSMVSHLAGANALPSTPLRSPSMVCT